MVWLLLTINSTCRKMQVTRMPMTADLNTVAALMIATILMGQFVT